MWAFSTLEEQHADKVLLALESYQGGAGKSESKSESESQ